MSSEQNENSKIIDSYRDEFLSTLVEITEPSLKKIASKVGVLAFEKLLATHPSYQIPSPSKEKYDKKLFYYYFFITLLLKDFFDKIGGKEQPAIDFTDTVYTSLTEMESINKSYILWYCIEGYTETKIESIAGMQNLKPTIFGNCKKLFKDIFGKISKCMEEITEEVFFQFSKGLYGEPSEKRIEEAQVEASENPAIENYLFLVLAFNQFTNKEKLSKKIYSVSFESVDDFFDRVKKIENPLN
jgi:hypothetical protein